MAAPAPAAAEVTNTADDVRVFVRAYPLARAKCAPALAAAYIRAQLDEVRTPGGLLVQCSAGMSVMHNAAGWL